jgi:hypothetical protein
MKHWNSDAQSWHLVPVKLGAERGFRRWDRAIISILVALVLGLLFTALVQQQAPGSTAHRVPSKIHHVS